MPGPSLGMPVVGLRVAAPATTSSVVLASTGGSPGRDSEAAVTATTAARAGRTTRGSSSRSATTATAREG